MKHGTQTRLAKELNIPKTSINGIIKGYRNASPILARRLAEQLRRDMSILAKKAGVKLKTLDDAVNPANWTTDIHENVSKLFEAYMRTGKAPIRELDGVFSLMKDLLTEIYKYAKDIIGIKVTKDVREVFDRQLTGFYSETNPISHELLDSKTNFSATFDPKNTGFNLSHEFKLGNNPTSKIATEGVSKAYVNRVISKMEPLFLTLKLDNLGKTINNKLAYSTKSTEGSMWENSPHLRLLYNFEVKDDNIVFHPNKNVAAAIDYSLKEFFANSSVSEMFDPMDYQLASFYGYNSETLSDDELNRLRQVVAEYGIPQTIIAQRIGDLILNNLNLKTNFETVHENYVEKTAMGLGMFALQYADTLGYVTERVFDPKAVENAKVKHLIK